MCATFPDYCDPGGVTARRGHAVNIQYNSFGQQAIPSMYNSYKKAREYKNQNNSFSQHEVFVFAYLSELSASTFYFRKRNVQCVISLVHQD